MTPDETATLLDDLAAHWERHDPMPPGLPDRVLVALATADLDSEYAVLTRAASPLSAAVRSTASIGAVDAITVEFHAGGVRLVVRVSRLDGDRRRLDAWIVPPRAGTVTLVASLAAALGSRAPGPTATAGDTGHAEFPDVAAGTVLLQLDLPPTEPDAGGHPALRLRTTAFEI